VEHELHMGVDGAELHDDTGNCLGVREIELDGGVVR
jgi:hypothetical protein